jgi:hypothetical protein
MLRCIDKRGNKDDGFWLFGDKYLSFEE